MEKTVRKRRARKSKGIRYAFEKKRKKLIYICIVIIRAKGKRGKILRQKNVYTHKRSRLVCRIQKFCFYRVVVGRGEERSGEKYEKKSRQGE